MAGPGTFISVGRSLEQAVERVRRAEALGYDSVYVTHIAGRDSLTVLMAYAAATERIKLGTGVLPIYSRTPVATAQQAATIDEFSGGRMVLGIGVSHQVTVENWYGTKIERPSPRCASTSTALRAMFEGRDAPPGNRFPTQFRFMGLAAAPRPADLRRRPVAEDAAARGRDRRWRDAVALQPRLHPPGGRPGGHARGASGPARGWRDSTSSPRSRPPSPTTSRAPSRRCAADLVTYWSLPFYRAMIERSGFAAEIAAFDEG